MSGIIAREQKRIQKFWNWFAENHPKVEAAYAANDTELLDSQLTCRIKNIQSDLTWEIGPYYDPDHTLIVSPAIRENIPLADRVVAAAPNISGWHFLAAKPPKHLTGLVMDLAGVQHAQVCAEQWFYRLTSYNKGEVFDIEVFTDAPASVKDRHLKVLTHRLIESLVGERIYLERLEAVTIYRPTDRRSREKTTEFPLLYKHMCELLEIDRDDS